jgi:predicted GIY-YIG superfamily endonuclease
MEAKFYPKMKLWNEKYKGIYGIFDSETGDALYIGSSIALNRRINRHKTNIGNLNYVRQWHPASIILYTSLSKHSNVFFQVIDECEKNIMKKLEKFYIKVYNPKYNINDRD